MYAFEDHGTWSGCGRAEIMVGCIMFDGAHDALNPEP